MRRTTLVRLGLLLAVVVAAVVAQLVVGLPSQAELRAALDVLGAWAPVVFVAAYVGVCLLPTGPTAVVTVVGGALFGFAPALVLVLVGANLGAVAGLSVSRVLGRGAVEDVDHTLVRRVDAQVRDHGFVTVLVARLIPLVPFSTSNYVFGLTSVRLRDYVPATLLGILPGSSVYVAVGAFGSDPGSLPFLLAVAALVLLSLVGLVRARLTRRRRGEGPRPGRPGGVPTDDAVPPPSG